MVTESTYRSDTRPDFTPFEESCGTITGFAYAGDLATEVATGGIDGAGALDLLDDMLAIRELEEMIVRLRSGGYDPLPGYDYRGPTHVSIGQEGTAVGASAALRPDDNITSSHRGHGDAIAKGFAAIRHMTVEQLRARVPGSAAQAREELLAAALEEHVYRTIAELFGKEEGYGRGRGGGMHIGDFSTGHLGANAIVGGSVPIATGAAMAIRYEQSDRVVCCFAGDGAYANGVVLESLNWAAQDQWTNHLAGDRAHGLPIIFFIQNNHYGMTHRTDEEVMGVRHLARRAAGFAENNMHAEVVNGMDVLAVRDAVRRAAALPAGEASPARGVHSPRALLSDPHRVPDPRGGAAGGPSTRSGLLKRQRSPPWRTGSPVGPRPERIARGRPRRRRIPTRRTSCATSTRTRQRTRSLKRRELFTRTPSRRSRRATRRAPSATRTPCARRWWRRWAATRGSSITARTWPTTAARSSSRRGSWRRSGGSASSTRRSARPAYAGPRWGRRSSASGRWSS
jgi:TPP-dependent pyruvate/acetoin dehydrogenase alpha subunit